MKKIEKIFGVVICGVLMLSSMPIKTLASTTNYKKENWKTTMPTSECDGDSCNAGSVEKGESTTETIIKGNENSGSTKWQGMKIGPYVEGGDTTIADSIEEELQIGLGPNKIPNGEFFEVSLSLKDTEGKYVNEINVMAQNVDGKNVKINVHGTDFVVDVTEDGIYTYYWKLFKDNGSSSVTFAVKKADGTTLKAETFKIDDKFTGPDVRGIDSKIENGKESQPVGADKVSVRIECRTRIKR